MGGENQSTLQPETKVEQQSTLQPDPSPMETLSMAEAVKVKKKKDKKKKKNKERPLQTQELRQHVSGGECHWHDDARKLKFAMTVADWYVVKRELQKLEVVERTDAKHQTIIRFTPFIENGVADCVVSVEPLKYAARFEQLLSLTK